MGLQAEAAALMGVDAAGPVVAGVAAGVVAGAEDVVSVPCSGDMTIP